MLDRHQPRIIMVSIPANRLLREVCGFCTKQIFIGQPTTICKCCDLIFHGGCSKAANIRLFRGHPYCMSCTVKNDNLIRYNPFYNLFDNQYSDKFYENEPIEFVECLERASNILENCKSYNTQSFSNNVISKVNTATCFSTFFLNIDGNKSNFDQLVADMNALNHEFSVIGLAETNINSEHKELYQISNKYSSIYQSGLENKTKGSGLGLYINRKHNYTVLKNFSVCNEHIETLFVKIANNETPITVGVIYRPPSGKIEQFNHQLQELFTLLPDRDVYILGDFNINLHDMSILVNEKYEELIVSSGYFPLISTATHHQPHCAQTCIDNILCNNIDNVILSGSLDCIISHHLPIFQFSDIPLEQASESSTKITIHYDYNPENINKFCSQLDSTLLNAYQNNSLNTFEEFDEVFQASIEETCKLSVPKTTKRNAINNPWITPGLISSINKKNKLYKNWKKSISSRNQSGDATKYEEYKAYHKILKGLIKATKSKYYLESFDKNKGNKKKTWEIINSLRGKVKNNIKASFIIDSERIICRRVIANKFNEYFSSLARNLNREAYNEMPITSFPSFESFMSAPCKNSMFMEDCDANEINEIIRDFANGKSSDIPIILIKRSCAIISPILSALINKGLSIGTFPKILKVGRITPVFKKGDKELIQNYRPVSTLPVFGKIFEKVIYARLYKFFTSQGTLSGSQFGFRKGHSTAHAIQHSVNIIKDAHEDRKHVIGIFIDLSKAFDTLDHRILLSKLSHSGVRGVCHELLASYLSEREQYTTVLGEKSNNEFVEFGVPQGSVLGPLLFLLYINDIVNSHRGTNCKFVLYADDTNIFVIDVSREAAVRTANIILESLNKFMKSNLLHINLGKCCHIYFEPPCHYRNRMYATCARSRPYIRKSDRPKIKMAGKVIDEVTETKFLGVIIDNKLSWLPHIANLYKKLKSATGTLNRIKCNIPDECRKSVYHALFESHMNYCISIFGGISNNHLEKLFSAQKHCIRILFGDFDAYIDKFMTCARTREFKSQILGCEFYSKEHTKPLFQKLNILAFPNVYNYQTCLETLKIIKYQLPSSLFERFTLSQRNNGTLLILPQKSVSFDFKGPQMWNVASKIIAKEYTLPNIKFGAFKRNLKSCLLSAQNKFDSNEWYPCNFKLAA